MILCSEADEPRVYIGLQSSADGVSWSDGSRIDYTTVDVVGLQHNGIDKCFVLEEERRAWLVQDCHRRYPFICKITGKCF